MSNGRVKVVRSNTLHVATTTDEPNLAVGVCSDWDNFLQCTLPWNHSILSEPRYLSPFHATLEALSHQWEVGSDLCRSGFRCAPSFCEHFASKLAQVPSQRPHSKHAKKRVRFEDHIDVFLGEDDVLAMHLIAVTHQTLRNWDAKPWDGRRTTKRMQRVSKAAQEPLSDFQIVSSRDSRKPFAHDDHSFMQTILKQDITNDPNIGLPVDFAQGQGIPQQVIEQTHKSDFASSGSSESPMNSIGSSGVHPPSTTGERQEVIIYHLQDEPIRTFLEWNDYYRMITEIAFHYSVNPAFVVDAYEIMAPLRGFTEEIVHIIAHLFPDIAVGQNAKLILFDIEVHGHRCEPHYRAGPRTRRFVMPTPEWVDRNTILRLTDFDQYCHFENGRCLMWLDNVRWPDYDNHQRRVDHGNYIRIAIPPSDRYACPTMQIIRLTQQGLSDNEIRDDVFNEDAQSGYSPSLLAADDVRELATTNFDTNETVTAEDDVFHAMQGPAVSITRNAENTSDTSTSDLEHIPPDWRIDLHRIVQQHIDQCNNSRQDEFLFSVYTWFLDHSVERSCNAPKIAVLRGAPDEWEEDILYPWQFRIIPNEVIYIDLVSPPTRRAEVEEHIAHVIITQRPSALISTLLALEFPDPAGIANSIFVRFAMAVPRTCSRPDIDEAVPFFARFDNSRLVWQNPQLDDPIPFLVRFGMCVKILVEPEQDQETSDDPDDTVNLMLKHLNIERAHEHRVQVARHDDNCHNAPTDSFTEEFLQAVDNVRATLEVEPMPLDPHSIEAQPAAFQAIWEGFVQMENVPGQNDVVGRVESWYLHHASFTRCHASRITVLGNDFTQWQSLFAATWNDKVQNSNELVFDLVHPEPEDCATGILAQIVISERVSDEQRSSVLSVYDSDPELDRQPYTFALVLPMRINLDRLLGLIHLSSDCPPQQLQNLCSLWFGQIPIGDQHEVTVSMGTAFRLVISRGIRLEVPFLLTLDHMQLRSILQRSIHSSIFDRPTDPAFMLSSSAVPSQARSVNVTSGDPRPSWIPVLERHFQNGYHVELPDYTPRLNVRTWYLNADRDHHCARSREVQVDEESFSWRSDFVFSWRDRLIRASAIDVTALHSLVPSTVSDLPLPHVILSQGLTSTQFVVLVSVSGTGQLHGLSRQFAHVFQRGTFGRDILRIAVPMDHAHRPAIIQFEGCTYFPDDQLFLQMGTHLAVIICDESTATRTIQDQEASGMMQIFHRKRQKEMNNPQTCKPAPFEVPDDLPMTYPGHHVQRPPLPAHDGVFDWSAEVRELFHSHGTTTAWEDEVSITITTWFIHHDLRPTCFRPRHIQLTLQPITWIPELRAAWRDLLDPEREFSVHLVRPRPPQYRRGGTVCHILLEQAPRPNRQAVLLTALFEGTPVDSMIQGAYSVEPRINLAGIIRIMEIAIYCTARQCTLVHRQERVQIDDWIDVRTGCSVYVRIAHQPTPEAVDDLAEHFEDLTLMQVSRHGSTFHFNPDAPAFNPARPGFETQPEHIHDLMQCWQMCDFAGEEETRSINVLTWFVAPGAGILSCFESRQVTLTEDFTQWDARLREQWMHKINPALPLQIVLVKPNPPHMETAISAHVLLVQEPLPEWSSPLLTIYDSAVNFGYPFRVAITGPDRASANDIITAANYARDCQWRGTRCEVRIEGHIILQGQYVALRDGTVLTLKFERSCTPDNWQPPFVPEMPGSEGLNLLQTAHRVVRIPNEPIATPEVEEKDSSEIQLDMQPVIEAYEWVDQHLFLPTYTVSDGVRLLPSSREWVDLPLWNIGMKSDIICVYLDGSFHREADCAGLAVAAFIRSEGKWYQGGMISSQIPADNAYVAEMFAALVASKLAFDLTKQVLFGQTCPCDIWFGFDSLTVGKQMTGDWNSHRLPLATSALRSLYRLLFSRFGIQPQPWHIPSHQGEAGNELVDALANDAAQNGGTLDVMPFIQFITQKHFVSLMEWSWMLFEPSYRRFWNDTNICLPKQPMTKPTAEHFPLQSQNDETTDETSGRGRISLCASSCNVLTLKGSDCQTWGLQGVARQESILEQFHLSGINIVALQETRLRRLYKAQDPRYVLVKSAATQAGCYGIVLGLSKKHPHGWIEQPHKSSKPICFQEQNVSIIAAEPRLLIVRLKTAVLRCIVIAAHAPHTGHSDEDVQNWWDNLGRLIPSKYAEWPRLLLCDANARVGSVATPQIGDHQAEAENSKSEFFRTFLCQQGLWLPATFSQHQQGPGGTWKHPNGNWLRGDYIGLPVQWAFDECIAFVDPELDVSTIKEDHRAVVVRFAGPSPVRLHKIRHATTRMPDLAVKAIDPSIFGSVIKPDFFTDVHTHASNLERQLMTLTEPATRGLRDAKQPRKASMSADTWQLVLEKKTWRKHYWQTLDLQRLTTLRFCFQAFQNHNIWQHQGEDIRCLVKHQDQLIAQAMRRLQVLGTMVVKAIRYDDAQFFKRLAREAGEYTQPHQAKQLWNVVRRSLPKHQQRRMQAPPEQLESLEEQWHPYFQHLEAGSAVSVDELLQGCHDFQTEHGSIQSRLQVSELPTLQQLEDMFRRTSPGKSTGLDPIAAGLFHAFPAEAARLFFDLILKIFVWQAEPLSYKGGIMAVIPKRLGASEAGHFRGIMLLPTVAKRLHALLRTKTIQLIARVKPAGQLGGFQHQQVGFASQALRTFCRIAQHHCYSTGVLFIDLSNAFHRLVRELVCGIGSEEDIQAVLEVIENDQLPIEGLRAWLAVPGLLERLGASPMLIQLMREVHTNTWHTLAALPGITRTRRGTRPGSPLADVVFHVLMMDIIIEINTWIEADESYQALLTSMNVQFDTIVWSDDLAIPWCTEDASSLVPAIECLLRAVSRFFTRRGFDLNMWKGKTGAVLTFQGQGAPALRKQFLLSEPSGFWCDLDAGKQVWLHATATYRHLGTQFASRLDFTEELRHRIGQAASAFGAMKRQVFCNRFIDVNTRLQLFHALVCTRLYFGLGTWHTPQNQHLKQLQKVLAHFLRCILAAGKKPTADKMTDRQLFLQANFLEPRIRLAQDRLLFAHKVFQHGPSFAQHLLHIEFQELSQSWISGLFADLQWLRATIPGCIPDAWTSDLTEAIEFWQKGAPGWKALVRRAGRLHRMQEAMMVDVHCWHRRFFHTLEQNDATFEPAFAGRNGGDGEFHCFCGRHFSTAQGLSTHKRKSHGIFSHEHDLLEGATCPVCLTHFWTTQRLQQHLAYISRRTGRNHCYQTLRKNGYIADYERVALPLRVLGMNRIEAIPVAGPQRHFPNQHGAQIQQWQQEIRHLEDQLSAVHMPCNPAESETQLFAGLTSVTKLWFQKFCDNAFDISIVGPLEDYWYDYLSTWPPELDDWYADQLLRWGQHQLPDIVAEFQDGEAESFADEAFYEVTKGMPRCQIRDRIAFLKQCIKRADDEFQQDVAHRPKFDPLAVQRVRASRSDPDAITTLFSQQTEWHDEVRKVQWDCLPKEAPVPLIHELTPQPVFLIVHLFSGRRRPFDVHWHLLQMAQDRGLDVKVLSMDTAVSPFYGDLTETSPSWQKLMQLYEQGLVAATICGAPCETFSAARHVPPPAELSAQEKKKWPRPLRSFARLFGLAGLRPRELRQCRQGSAFMMQAVMICILHLIKGGLFLSEHPAPPEDTTKASIWTSAILQLLRQHPDIALRIFDQWKWGAKVRKPTGLLSLRMPYLGRSMYACADLAATFPKQVAIGKDQEGNFRTAICKEYPPLFSAGLARAVVDQLCTEKRRRACQSFVLPATDLSDWLTEAMAESSRLYERSTHLPDYQGQ